LIRLLKNKEISIHLAFDVYEEGTESGALRGAVAQMLHDPRIGSSS